MGRLIDADKAIESMQYYHDDCAKTSEYTRLGFETAIEVVKDAPTVEAIPKADYENRLKSDLVAMLTDIQLEIEDCVDGGEGSPQFEQGVDIARCQVVDIIQQKIDALKGDQEAADGKD